MKGALERFTSWGLVIRLSGRTVGGSITGAVVKGALKEGVTEALQEEVNIAARKYVDPKYSYFGEEALYRRLDSFAAGVLMGGVVGGPTEALGRRTAKQTEGDTEAEDFSRAQSPVSALKRVLPFLQSQREQDLMTVFRADPKLDPLEVNVLLDTFGKDWARSGVRLNNEEAFYDWMEGQTTRYAVVNELGKTTELLNATDLERALTKFPARQNLAGRAVEVDQKLLSPAGITASIPDLIATDVMKRVYFLPSVDAGDKKRMMQEFRALTETKEFALAALDYMFEPSDGLKTQYGAFLDKGLRVLPTAGASYTFSGEFTGSPVKEIPKTGRSLYPTQQVAGTPPTVITRPIAGTLQQLRKYGIDTTRLQPGDVLSDDITKWVWPQTLPESERTEIKKEWKQLFFRYGSESAEVLDKMQELLDKGIYAEVTTETENIVLNRKVIAAQKMVPTTQTAAESMEELRSYNHQMRQRTYTPRIASVQVLSAHKLNVEQRKAVSDMNAILKAIDPIFAKHKLPSVTSVSLRPDALKHNGYATMSGGIELFFTPDLTYEQYMFTFIHELGHIVTIGAWNKLPTDQIERIYQSYRRNVLADSLTDAKLASNFENTARRQQRHAQSGDNYAYTFTEYLAEQFGRWMYSRGLASNPTAGVFKEISGILREVTEGIITWNASLGDTVDAKLRLIPDYEFGRVMDILFELEEETTMAQKHLGATQKLEIPNPYRNEVRQRSLLDELYDLTIENPVLDDFEDAFAEAKQAIVPMLPKGWTVEAGAPGSGNDAVANTSAKTIILGLGALRLGVGPTLVHEVIHALRAEGLFTPAEWRALVREIRQDGALWGAVREKYTAELTRKAEKLAKTIRDPGPDFVQNWVKDKLEEEAVAFATSIRFAGGNVGGTANSLLDRIIAFLREVKNRLIERGYVSPGDVRRRIFSGQVAGRLEREAKFARWDKREQEFAANLPPGAKLAVGADAAPFSINPLAAIRLPDGRIVEGATHVMAIVNANLSDEMLDKAVAGWMVNGRFLTRDETAEFMKRKDDYLVTEQLTAEDLGQTVIKVDGGWRVAPNVKQGDRTTSTSQREALTMPTSERTERLSIMTDPEIIELDKDLFLAVKLMDKSGYVRMYAPPAEAFSPNMSNNAKYLALGDLIGVVDIHKNRKGWEVDWVKVNKKSYDKYPKRKRHMRFSDQVYGYLSERLGFNFQPSGTLTEKGYAAWKVRDPQAVRYHVWVPEEDMYHSPNYIRDKLLYWESRLDRAKAATDPTVQHELWVWRAAYARVPKEAWTDPELPRMFARALTTGMFTAMWEQDRANKERFITEQQVPPAGFDEIRNAKAEASKLKNAEILGVEPKLSAADQPELMAMKGLTKWRGLTPQERRALTGMFGEADRITAFSKRWWGIQQLMWANKHFTSGQQYIQAIEAWTALRERWVMKADQVSRKWDRLKPRTQRDALAKTLFYMTEMQYLTAQERRRKVVRQPTQQETIAAFTQFGLNADGQALFAEVNKTFADFLNEFEQIAQKSLRREFTGNPAGLQKAQIELAADVAAMRAKPYFPLSRFGEWTLTVRDATNQKMEAFYTFSSEVERNRYILIARQQWPMSDLRVGKLPATMQDYVQLPGPVLKRIKATLPGITPQQKTWIDQLEHQTAPERSFRKHWMTREGTPGYSLDAMRAFSNYLNTGAGYLARLAYKDEAQDVITAATNDAKLNFADSSKRFDLISEMQEHLNYMLEPGRDGSKLRSFAAMWFLGFSPAAAAMNLTQIPVFTVPYLSSLFEGSAVKRALTDAYTALKGTIAAQIRNPPSPGYEKARQELISMGKIDAGQAPELGVYASTDNLTRSAAGEKAQRTWRNFTKASMWMFGKTERFNRELTFAMTFDLAMQAQGSGKQNKYLSTLFTNNSIEILDLISRTGMTQEEAVATIAAKEAIDRTQFTYSPWARPKFMRGNVVASDLLVFFGYIQSALYAVRHNPGRIKTLLTMFALYGMMGLPFAGDLDKLIEALARRLFGKDWSPQQEARELIVLLSKNTAFEKTGADLFLHGISRFGFGPGLLPEGWGAPRFDASANGSMGNIIPVVPDMVKGWGHYGKWKEMVGDAAQKGAGAGYGYFFSLLQFLAADPHTANWKKWEAIMPRALKAASKGTRYATAGEEKSRSGAVIAQFDPRDPDDLATIVTQFLGFTPQKLAVHYEALQQKKESEMFYKGWRMALYTQLNEAIQGGTKEVIDDVLSGILKYNAEVQRQGIASMQINTRQAISSLKGRARSRVLEEQGLPVTKGAVPLYQRIDESFPLLERKIVK